MDPVIIVEQFYKILSISNYFMKFFSDYRHCWLNLYDRTRLSAF